jgi:hypothetical protein
MRPVLVALCLMTLAAPALAQTCHQVGLTTRCSDGSSTQFVNGRWLYRPAPTAKAFVWTWPFIIPARELRSVRQLRLVSPRP